MILALREIPRALDAALHKLVEEALRDHVRAGRFAAAEELLAPHFAQCDAAFALCFAPAVLVSNLEALPLHERARALDVFVACPLALHWEAYDGPIDGAFLSLLSFISSVYHPSVLHACLPLRDVVGFFARLVGSPDAAWMHFVMRSNPLLREDFLSDVVAQAFTHASPTVARDVAHFFNANGASLLDVALLRRPGLLHAAVRAALALPHKRRRGENGVLERERALAATQLLCRTIETYAHAAVVVRDVLVAEVFSAVGAAAHPAVLIELVLAVQRALPYRPLSRKELARLPAHVTAAEAWAEVWRAVARVEAFTDLVAEPRWVVQRR